jgi:hypothetical protein
MDRLMNKTNNKIMSGYRLTPEFREEIEEVLNRLIETCEKCNEANDVEAAAYNLKNALDKYSDCH